MIKATTISKTELEMRNRSSDRIHCSERVYLISLATWYTVSVSGTIFKGTASNRKEGTSFHSQLVSFFLKVSKTNSRKM
jgi:hypothetical protein